MACEPARHSDAYHHPGRNAHHRVDRLSHFISGAAYARRLHGARHLRVRRGGIGLSAALQHFRRCDGHGGDATHRALGADRICRGSHARDLLFDGHPPRPCDALAQRRRGSRRRPGRERPRRAGRSLHHRRRVRRVLGRALCPQFRLRRGAIFQFAALDLRPSVRPDRRRADCLGAAGRQPVLHDPAGTVPHRRVVALFRVRRPDRADDGGAARGHRHPRSGPAPVAFRVAVAPRGSAALRSATASASSWPPAPAWR